MIEAYIKARGLQGDRASKIRGHLVMCEPYGEDYQAIREFLQSLTKKKDGSPKYSEKTVTEIIRDYQNYISWTKENNEIMYEEQNKQLTIEETEQAKPEMSTVRGDTQAPEVTQTSNENPEATTHSPVNIEEEQQPVKRAGGRPKTGRTEKFTLYMSAEAMEDLTMLTAAYNTNITELLNKFIDDYRTKQTRQIAFLKKQKQEFINMFADVED